MKKISLDTEEIMDWYKGPLTKRHIAELRYKLALAKGMLKDLQSLLKRSANVVRLSIQEDDIENIIKIIREITDPKI